MTLRDPDAPRRAAAAGVGATVDLVVGAHYGRAFYDPVRLRARVIATSDGRFQMSAATLRGMEMRMGAAAALRAGRLTLVVHEHPTLTNDPALYRSLGLEPATAQAVVVKHPIGWRVGMGELAASAMYVDLPGASTPRLARLPFARVPRPMWPLDPDAVAFGALGAGLRP
jgi:microcystin degradation protein MlrC